METVEVGRFSVCWGMSWGKDSLAASEGLFLPLALASMVHYPVAVAKFIVLPENELDTVVVEGNASPSIKAGRVGVPVKVAGDNLALSVAEDAFERPIQCLLHHLLDVIIFGSFLLVAGLIYC